MAGVIHTENIVVPIDTIHPNDFNPKPDYKEDIEYQLVFNKLRQSLDMHGQVLPLLVREDGEGKYEIINGEHRWLAMKELGFAEAEVKNLGPVSRAEAIKIALSTEELRIPLDEIEVAKLIKELADAEDTLGLPYTEEEMRLKMSILDFAFQDIPVVEQSQEEEKAAAESAKTYFFPVRTKQELAKVLAAFGRGGKRSLDTKKLLNLIYDGGASEQPE